MKSIRKSGQVLALVSALGMCLPIGNSAVLAGELGVQATPQACNRQLPSVDVVLTDGDALRGAVVNADGTAASRCERGASRPGPEDSQGPSPTSRDSFRLLDSARASTRLFATGQDGKSMARKVVRAWNHKAAPPTAVSLAILDMSATPSQDIARGQFEGGLASDPLVLAGVGLGVAAAIAVPIRHHQSESPRQPVTVRTCEIISQGNRTEPRGVRFPIHWTNKAVNSGSLW